MEVACCLARVTNTCSASDIPIAKARIVECSKKPTKGTVLVVICLHGAINLFKGHQVMFRN